MPRCHSDLRLGVLQACKACKACRPSSLTALHYGQWTILKRHARSKRISIRNSRHEPGQCRAMCFQKIRPAPAARAPRAHVVEGPFEHSLQVPWPHKELARFARVARFANVLGPLGASSSRSALGHAMRMSCAHASMVGMVTDVRSGENSCSGAVWALAEGEQSRVKGKIMA